jgi:hypothetical protein
MIVPDAFWIFVAAIAGMIAWKLFGARIQSALHEFDNRRIESDRQAIQDASNPLAHFRRSIDAINEQTEPVKLVRMADGSRQPQWRGVAYDSVDAAEEARWDHVIQQARGFYSGLDEDFGLRVAGPAPKTATEE